MLTGPDLLNNLDGVLLRFKNHKIAIAADIEAMYYQVRVSKSDANTLRFFLQDYLTQDVQEIHKIFVHIFVGKDSPNCENYALKKRWFWLMMHLQLKVHWNNFTWMIFIHVKLFQSQSY